MSDVLRKDWYNNLFIIFRHKSPSAPVGIKPKLLMEGAHHHTEGHHEHPVGNPHEMSSSGVGDAKL